MAEEVVKVEVVVEGDQAGKKIKDLKKELKGTEQEAKKASESMKAISTEGISAKARLRALKDEMSSMADQGSPKFQQLAAEAGKLKDQMNNANAAITTMSSDFPKLQVGIQAFQGIGAAAQFAAGAQLLFGSENKEVQKAMQRAMALTTMMTAVQQIANTVSDEAALGIKLRTLNQKLLNRATLQQAVATGTATTAQKVMNVVMSANPIGLVVTAIGLLVTGIIAFSKPVRDFIKQWDSLYTVMLLLLGPIGWIILAYEKLFGAEAQLEAQRKKDQKERNKRHQEELDQIKETRDEFIKASNDKIEALELQILENDALGKSSYALNLQILEEQQAQAQAVRDANAQMIQSKIDFYKNEAKLRGQSEEEFTAMMLAQGVDFEMLQLKANELLAENEINVQKSEWAITKLKREEAEKRAKNAKSKADEEAKIEADRLKAEEEANKKALKALEDKRKAEIKAQDDLLKRRIAARDELARMERDKNADEVQMELNDLEDAHLEKMDTLSELIPEENALRLALEEEYLANRQEILDAADAAELEARKEKQAEIIEQAFDSAETLLSIAESFNSIASSKEIKRIKDKQDRGERLTKNEIARLERQEKIQKAFAIAQVAIDTARGISAAVAAGAGLPFPANIPAILSGVAAVLGGVAQAQQILGESNSVDVGGIGDVGETAQDVTDNGQAPLRNIESGSTLLNQEPQVVVVVEDINNGQNSVAVIESQASF